MEIHIEERFDLDEANEALLVADGRLWAAGAPRKEVISYEGLADAQPHEVGTRQPLPTSTGGMAWDGSRLIVADASTRHVSTVDPESGAEEPLVDVEDLDFADFPDSLRTEGARIGDIAWDEGQLWIACIAGYSSSIYRVDPVARAVRSHVWSPGPQPVGVDHDARGQRIFVVEARGHQLARLDAGRDWSVTAVPDPIEEPTGLNLELPGILWIRDAVSSALYRLAMEE